MEWRGGIGFRGCRRDALTKLYVSFSKAVKCPEGVLRGRSADFRALYRSVDEKEVNGFDT